MEQKFNLQKEIQFLLEDNAENLLNILLQKTETNRQEIGYYCSHNNEFKNIGDYSLDLDSESSWIEFFVGEELIESTIENLNSNWDIIYSDINNELYTYYPINILSTNNTITISIEI